jgi:phthiocerol/phenolphthiocerol synthesis type-I polyketide synthase C
LSDIHFIGRACRLPGAPDVEAFKNILFENRCSVSSIPQDRWAHQLYYHPTAGTKGKSYSFAAGVLDDIWGFDPNVFKISPREASQMDPQQRILLQVVWEALEDAGLVPSDVAGQHIGVYVGCSALDHSNRLVFDADVADSYMMTGNTLSLVSNRISHAFDLRGPSMTVDTACSSSLLALHIAEKALLAGEIDTAIVAGVNMLLSPMSFVGFSAARMLSAKGLCQPFSADADGYVRAEGAVALVLRRSDLTSLHPFQSYGKLAGVDTNTDGHTVNVALPSSEGQLLLLQKIYNKTGIDPVHLDFVEAHGTGTLVGDPIEASAIGAALGQLRSEPLPIGSVKSNIGHLEPASGLAGVLKTLVSLEERCLPASLHASTQNPNIDFQALNLKVTTRNLDLLDAKRFSYAGVSSFGFGGTNVHAIIEAPEIASAAIGHSVSGSLQQDKLLFTSAFAQQSLNSLVHKYEADLKGTDNETHLSELCSQALHFRGAYPERLVVVCGTKTQTTDAISSYNEGLSTPCILTARAAQKEEAPVFLFSGNGAQYAGMSKAALATDQAFREHYTEISLRFGKLSGWSLLEQLDAPSLADDLVRAEVAQPLLFADQISLCHALSEYGLTPKAVLGHSGGEVAAACVSGVLSLDQALNLIHQRSKSQMKLAGRGTMAALQVSAEQAVVGLGESGFDEISIAAINSPKSVTISGPSDQISEFLTYARRIKRWAAVPLKINYPYHSSIQDEIKDELRLDLDFIQPQECRVPFLSSVTGSELAWAKLGSDYWWDNVRQPVQFMDAIHTAAASGYRAFLEIGPQPVLTNYVNDSLGEDADSFINTFSFERADTKVVNPVQRTVARGLVSGCFVEKSKIYPRPEKYLRNLPAYPWSNTVMRIDGSSVIERHHGNTADYHPLLGRELNGMANTWLSDFGYATLPEFRDHVVGNSAIAPGTYFAELAVSAAQRSLKQDQVELTDFDIITALSLTEGVMHEVRTQISTRNGTLQISSHTKQDHNNWRDHVNCRVNKSQSEVVQLTAPNPMRLETDLPGDSIYEMAKDIGLQYGPGFQRVNHFRRLSDDVVEVILKDKQQKNSDFSSMALEPVGIDAIFHGLIGLLQETKLAQEPLAFVPVHISRLQLFKSGSDIGSGRIKLSRLGNKTIVADVECFDHFGETVVKLSGVRFNAVNLLVDVNIEAHSFRYISRPIARLTGVGKTECQAEPNQFQAVVEKVSENLDLSPQDDAGLLLEAAALRIGYDALSQIADTSGYVAYPTNADINGGTAPNHQGHYFINLANQLADREMLEIGVSGCTIVPGISLPQVNDILGGLLTDRPDLVVEYSALIRLQSVLTDILRGNAESDANALFGRNFLDVLKSGSVFGRRQSSLMHDVVLGLAKEFPKDRTVRIADLNVGKSYLLNALQQTCQVAGLELYHLNDPENFENAEGSSTRVTGNLTTTGVSPSSLNTLGPFDLIVVSQALHELSSSEQLLSSLGSALSEAGRLVVIEPLRSTFSDLIFGLDASWFDRSVSAAFPISLRFEANEVENLLVGAGLTVQTKTQLPEGLGDALLISAIRPSAEIDASPPEIEATQPNEESWRVIQTLVARRDRPEIPLKGVKFDANTVISSVTAISLETGSAKHAPELFCVHNMPECLDQQELLENRILYLGEKIQQLAEQGVSMWVIIPAGVGCSTISQTPGQSAIWAFLRSAQNEYPGLEIKCVDQDPDLTDEMFAKNLAALIASGTEETEILLYADRYDALRVINGQNRRLNVDNKMPLQIRKNLLTLPTAGRLEDISWKHATRPALGETEIEVEVAATGLNYRDVMWSMGVLPEEALENGFAGPTLGIECSGTVARKGVNANKFAVGDRVVTFGPGCFSTHVTIDEAWAGKLVPNQDLIAAATIPVAFFTAYYALQHLAQISSADTVLIHGGAGGVGLAAIQIAQAKGAQIIATAGSPVKRDLLSSLGVQHVLDSRSLTFGKQVRDLTNGAGVDIVLNSLAGEAMELSLNSLAPFGRFLELGKQDFYSNTSVGLRPLKENLSYIGVDVDQFLAAKPELAKQLFDKMMQMFQSGDLTPLPYRAFPGEQIVDAFRLMQKSGHIGKIVVQPKKVDVETSSTKSDFKPCPVGAHIIVGGLGGIGFHVMNWLAKNGAKTIVLCGRTAKPQDGVKTRITQLRQRGISVHLYTCDIGDETQLRDMLAQIRSKHAICGIVHSAMVLEDMPISELSRASLQKTLTAKVTGTENLDRLTREDKLDYFVLFSSIATLIGNHGQSAYVAANAYLEGVARRRKQSGHSALAIGWGPINDAGYLTRDKAKAALVNRFSGNVEFTARQAMVAMGKLLSRSADDNEAVVYITPMRWHETTSVLKSLSSPTYRTIQLLGQNQDVRQGFDNLRETLVALPAKEAEERLTNYLLGSIAQMLQIPENSLTATQPVAELGMDSLMGVDLGLTLQKSLGDDIPMTVVSETLSVRDIARNIANHIKSDGSDNSEVDVVRQNLVAQHRLGDEDNNDEPMSAAE